MLHTGRSWVPFPVKSLNFSVDVILPVALCPWGRLRNVYLYLSQPYGYDRPVTGIVLPFFFPSSSLGNATYGHNIPFVYLFLRFHAKSEPNLCSGNFPEFPCMHVYLCGPMICMQLFTSRHCILFWHCYMPTYELLKGIVQFVFAKVLSHTGSLKSRPPGLLRLLCAWNVRVLGRFVNISGNSKQWAGEDVNQETLLL
jgi:hypothetical protein